MHDIQLYVMDKHIMDEGYPWPNTAAHVRPHVPYHDGWYVLATATRENPNPGQIADFQTEEEVLKALERVRGMCSIIIGRHPLFPEEVNIQGDVEKYRGTISQRIRDGLAERGIEYTIGRSRLHLRVHSQRHGAHTAAPQQP